jgi:hypothetical protein
MDWTCTLTEERLSDYLDHHLTAEEAGSFSAHLSGCSRCARLVEMVSGLVVGMQQLDLVEEPPHLASKILDATIGPRPREEGWRRWIAWAPAIWQPRFAMGALTVVASFLVVFHTAGLTSNKLKRLNLNPLNVFRTANRQAHLVYAHSVKFVNDLRVVYEIQSRLQPEPVPVSPPAPGQTPQPSSPHPQQKSETKPPHGHSRVQGETMLALALPGILTSEAARSPR